VKDAREFTARLEKGRQAWVEIDLPDPAGWRAAGLFFVHEGQLVLAEVRVFPKAGKFPPPVPLSKMHKVETGTRTWWFGPLQVGPEAGKWSQSRRALKGMPEGGITTRLLRRVPVQELVDAAQRYLAAVAPRVSKDWEAAARREPARPGRAGREDYFYALWAKRYVDKLGMTKTPIPDLAREHGKEPSQVRDWVHKARERDLLSREGQGRAKGMLTPKGHAALGTGGRKRK
jgi:hypothetical protein